MKPRLLHPFPRRRLSLALLAATVAMTAACAPSGDAAPAAADKVATPGIDPAQWPQPAWPLAEDPALATNAQRVALRPELLKWLGDTLRAHRIEALVPKLEAAGLPYAPVVRPDQLVSDPHLIESGGLVDMGTEDGGTTKTVLLPLLMDGRRPGVRRSLPRIGEHTDEVLGSLATRRQSA